MKDGLGSLQRPLEETEGALLDRYPTRVKHLFRARGSLRAVALACGLLTATGQAQMGAVPLSTPVTLDLNPAPGDQARREVRGVRQGDEVVVEILGLRDARGCTGFTATLGFDPAQLSYGSFEAGGLIPGMQVLPLLRGGVLEVGGSRFGGGPGATEDGGTLGLIRFKTTPRFKGQTSITLTRVSYRKRGETRNFGAQVKVTLSSEAGTPAGPAK